jgi:hypothetical protein
MMDNTQAESVMFAGASSALNFVIPEAHAVTARGTRATAAAINKLAKALGRAAHNEADAFPKTIDGIKGITQALKKTDLHQIRKTAFDPQTVQFAKAAGRNSVTKLFRRMRNIRMSPLTIAATVAYLESRLPGNCPEDQADFCIEFPDQVADKLPGLYKKAFSEQLLTSSHDFVFGFKENGAMFHLTMLAMKQLAYELTGNTSSGLKVLAIEHKVDAIPMISATGTPYQQTYGRTVDIVLAGEEGNSVVNDKSVWVEVKSYRSPPERKYFRQWRMTRESGYPANRQFFLDRAALVDHSDIDDRFGPLAKNFEWWFQDFNRPSIKGYSEAIDLPKVRPWLRRLPKPMADGLKTLKLDTVSENDRPPESSANDNRIHAHNVKTWILNTARNYLLNDIQPDVIEELIADSNQF